MSWSLVEGPGKVIGEREMSSSNDMYFFNDECNVIINYANHHLPIPMQQPPQTGFGAIFDLLRETVIKFPRN
jgi:hypothetical protein